MTSKYVSKAVLRLRSLDGKETRKAAARLAGCNHPTVPVLWCFIPR